jgi:hypothetical protein
VPRTVPGGGQQGLSRPRSLSQSSAEQAVRCLLHAAALGGRSSTDLYRWSLSAVQAREAVMILSAHKGAALSWHQPDQKQRDSVWAMVAIAFAALADPRVLDAVSPGEGEEFDPETFLRSRGTVYLLGTSTERRCRRWRLRTVPIALSITSGGPGRPAVATAAPGDGRSLPTRRDDSVRLVTLQRVYGVGHGEEAAKQPVLAGSRSARIVSHGRSIIRVVC